MDGFNFLFDRLAGAMFLDIFAGNVFALFVFYIFFLALFGIALRLTGEMMVLSLLFGSMIFLTFMVSSMGWVLGLIVLIIGIFVGLYLIYALIAR